MVRPPHRKDWAQTFTVYGTGRKYQYVVTAGRKAPQFRRNRTVSYQYGEVEAHAGHLGLISVPYVPY